jgi:hypothetical protein
MTTVKFATSHDILAHYGVKGMRWGVSQERQSSTGVQNLKPQGVAIGKDGSVSIEKGSSLQRLVRSNGQSLPMKDITYASINAYDNARYIKVIGGKGFFGGGRDTVLSLQTTQPIKAPSVTESTRIVSNMMVNDPQFRLHNTKLFGAPINAKELAQLKADPVGKTAQAWYVNTNTKLTFDPSFDPDAPHVQKRFREEFQSRGYNAVRDENDVRSKIAKAPLIIFSPEKSLKVVKKTTIDDKLRKANKQQLKQYKRTGKDWVEKELYGA